MKVNLSVITLCLGLLILAPGCSTSKMKNNTAIEGREWSLVSVQSKDGSTKLTPAEDQQPTLSILQGRVSGSAGCNRIMGSVVVEGNTLKFDKVGTTMMFCPDAMNLEDAVLNVFGLANNYKVTGTTLELKKDSEVLAVYKIK